MNRLQGHIAKIEVQGDLSMVSVAINQNILLKAIVIETPETATYLREGCEIAMLFKETEVVLALGKNLSLSIPNKIPATIINIEKGSLLSRVSLNTPAGELIALIGTDALKRLDLKPKMEVIAMIKLNEIILLEL